MFKDFDFQQLYDPDFKEDSVREVLILPIIERLGYSNMQVVRSKSLQHPFLKIGSKKRPVNLVPDYLFKIEDSYAWVLDAKAPTETITSGNNLEQIFSYAIHPEVRTKFFALCNGREFILFRQDEEQPLLYFLLQDIENYWQEVVSYLSPSSFQSGKNFTYTSVKQAQSTKKFDYLKRPLLEELPVKKQSAKRHFGVHGYFTKQSWNVVQEYIRNFSQAGDTVLDPFGGSGVTAIESLMTDRKAIHIDLNPLSVFMVSSLIAPINTDDLHQAFAEIKTEYLAQEPNTEEEIKKALKKYPSIQNAQIIQGTATDLSFIKKESIDYIYTDPPYGKKIPYLDLSVMWNGWLDLAVTEEDYAQEAIEGGDHNKTKDEYNELIAKSIQEMYRVLKFDRWMSFVFAHKDPEFWHLIVETAEKCGFEYAGAVKQSNGQTSFKKRQNPFTVLSGQLIINFRKVRKPRYIMKAVLGMNTGEIIIQTCEGIIAKNNGATLEQINDELIIKGLELGFLDLLKKEYSDLTPFLLDTFDYDDQTELFTIRKNQKFKTHLDLNLRVKYYLFSFLRRQEIEDKTATFDEIVLYIMPLLKNGITPEEQTILNVLEDIAEQIGTQHWRLKQGGQQKLFL